MSVHQQRGTTIPQIAAVETEQKEETDADDWVSTVPPEFLQTLPDSEVNRQK